MFQKSHFGSRLKQLDHVRQLASSSESTQMYAIINKQGRGLAIIDAMAAYEAGKLDPVAILNLYGWLIKTGRVWGLVGRYARNARIYIDAGWIDESGKVLEYQV